MASCQTCQAPRAAQQYNAGARSRVQGVGQKQAPTGAVAHLSGLALGLLPGALTLGSRLGAALLSALLSRAGQLRREEGRRGGQGGRGGEGAALCWHSGVEVSKPCGLWTACRCRQGRAPALSTNRGSSQAMLLNSWAANLPSGPFYPSASLTSAAFSLVASQVSDARCAAAPAASLMRCMGGRVYRELGGWQVLSRRRAGGGVVAAARRPPPLLHCLGTTAAACTGPAGRAKAGAGRCKREEQLVRCSSYLPRQRACQTGCRT